MFPATTIYATVGDQFRNIQHSKCSFGVLIDINPTSTSDGDLLKVKVQIKNLTTSNIDSGIGSFMNVLEGSELTITDSSLKNIYSYEDGAVLKAGYRAAMVEIRNSLIQYNSAIEGGVFMVEDDSMITIFNCSITNNFALLAGVIKAHNNGVFHFRSYQYFLKLCTRDPYCTNF